MTESNDRHPAFSPLETGEMSALNAPSNKAVWQVPKLTRMDISLTQTAFNATPDGDSSS